MSTASVLEYSAVASLESDPSLSHVIDDVAFQVNLREGEHQLQKQLGSKDLYPLLERGDSVAGTALRMLDSITGHIKRAAELSNTLVDIDTELMKSRILLSKAFGYRDSLGEGYAGIVNAAAWALANASADLPSRRQIRVLGEVLEKLRSLPYMRFDSAMKLMDQLESEGFDIEPPSLDDLLVDDHA
jgi:hypothetical protein